MSRMPNNFHRHLRFEGNLPHVDVSDCETSADVFKAVSDAMDLTGSPAVVLFGEDSLPISKAMSVPENKPKFKIGDRVRLTETVIRDAGLENDPDARMVRVVDEISRIPYSSTPMFSYSGYGKFGKWSHCGWELEKVEDDEEEGKSVVMEYDERLGKWVTRKMKPSDFIF